VARNAEEAMERLCDAVLRGDPFELALLDCNMPGESGVQLARRIAATASLRATRMILLTPSGQVEANAEDAHVGCRLTKPVRQSRLLDAISVVMAHELDGRHEVKRASQADTAPREFAQAGSLILVAEDHHVNWLLIERMLAKRGHIAHNARDGRRAIEMLTAGEYDLVLMDCQMPVLDGYSATDRIRRWEAAERRDRVPIVAMTAHAMLGDRERCVSAGMDDYIAKPIRAEELDGVLARWLPAKAPAASLDRRPLEELRSLFPGAEMSSIARELVADLREQIGNIAAALSSGDRAIASHAAHRVITTARVIGANDLAQAARRLELLAGEDHSDGQVPLESALRALSARWQEALAAAERELRV
jgi:CheY-like chemotaxis protein/HPt (histidine-containing phosphotransfer) domain-containing protein